MLVFSQRRLTVNELLVGVLPLLGGKYMDKLSGILSRANDHGYVASVH